MTVNYKRFERMKCLSKTLESAANRAEKAIELTTKKHEAASKAYGADKQKLEKEAQVSMGAALAALDECKSASTAAVVASIS